MKKILFTLMLAIVSAGTASAVTLNVKVPDGTKKCYVCGSLNNWDAGSALAMEPNGTNLFKLSLPDVDAAKLAEGYKYLCGQDWLYVEKDASGGEISNRTVAANPDIVESWRTIPEWSVISEELVVNNIPRQIKVYLPEGYDENPELTYPVIYYNSVQQRYNNAGADDDNGDYFFGPQSWNAQNTMENLRATGVQPYIMVQINSFPAENTISSHPDFAGSGASASYLKAFINELMPVVENKWRVRKGADNTIIVGADYGALFALYASLSNPELFSRCVAMSPMLWVNNSDFVRLAASGKAGQSFYVSAGSLEPEWMRSDAQAFADALTASDATAYFTIYPGARHDDDSWGESFQNVLKAIEAGSEPTITARKLAPATLAETADFENAIYTLYAGPDSNNLERIGKLVYTNDYRKKDSDIPVKAWVITYDIPLQYKSKYYWNIACGEDNSSPWLFTSPKDIGFSSKKNADSWHNIALFEDGSSQNNAAHSKGFRVVTSKESVLMSQAGGHTSVATIKFPGEDKSFNVHFGSVNSASDMGALTPNISVSDNCIEADIYYDFELNKVTVNETQFGESLDKVKIVSFTAVPAVATAGSDIKVNLHLTSDCMLELNAKRNFNESVGLAFTRTAPGDYSLNISDAKEGIYSLSVDFIAGENRLNGAGEINIRVLPASGENKQKKITVNAYKDIDWNNVGRYKANFHTHTSQSFDTNYSTTQVVDRYKDADYQILALTDHDANPYPWTMFDLYNPEAEGRNPSDLGMLAIPGCELSKDRRNNWSESTGGEFNHHTDLFTGRHGQEFMSLRESYAYTEALGGLQIINHPGQYWNLSTEYKNGEKNSPEWHAEKFSLYSSLVGMEAYNQGNRRQNDRVLWDQILTLTMPKRPVWGFSCDDTHTSEQYFRNYQYMLMPDLSADELKDALKNGRSIFSYEYTGSGKAQCPHIESINVDEDKHLITVNSEDADNIKWISSFHRTGSNAASATNTVVGHGKTFDYSGFNGTYVRALLVNKHGETATQPFGFDEEVITGIDESASVGVNNFKVTHTGSTVIAKCNEGIDRISVFNPAGIMVKYIECGGSEEVAMSISEFDKGVYILVAACKNAAYTDKFVKE